MPMIVLTSFEITPLVNEQWQWSDPQIDTLLAEANRRLGELNGLSLIAPNLDSTFRCTL